MRLGSYLNKQNLELNCTNHVGFVAGIPHHSGAV